MRLRPLSARARKILFEKLDGNSRISAHQRRGRKLFVVSESGRYCAWVDLFEDKDWEIIFGCLQP